MGDKNMGEKEMKCVQCGTTNINEILVSFIAEDEYGEEYLDTTILSKFLYYLEYPADKRGKHQPVPFKLKKVKYYSCTNCKNNRMVEGKKSDVGLRIPSRRYGI